MLQARGGIMCTGYKSFNIYLKTRLSRHDKCIFYIHTSVPYFVTHSYLVFIFIFLLSLEKDLTLLVNYLPFLKSLNKYIHLYRPIYLDI